MESALLLFMQGTLHMLYIAIEICSSIVLDIYRNTHLHYNLSLTDVADHIHGRGC